MKRSAFTLIELLVVIAIIAVLAGIALPVFGKVQERSRAINCAANLKQIGIGLQAYLNDHNDQMFKKDAQDEFSWPRQLNPKYIPGWKVFRSPFDKVSTERIDSEKTPGAPVSYGINENCFSDPQSKTPTGNASQFVAPSQLILMAPAMEEDAEIKFIGTAESNPRLKKPQPAAAGGGKGEPMGTHFKRAQINALYADWHAAAISYREFSSSEDEEGLKRWYPGGEDPTKQQ